ncbi:B3 domain-containing transcription factor VRN1-like [Ricinus communis]|uniref:B3 domain-containing transcription factor VRN1-like n=1 Tax=Ricinus communis TaxID=3988 RepID=UPI00201A3700|nr:B3 domain-containing transcription factor VRN1-like [Ricinus communis]
MGGAAVSFKEEDTVFKLLGGITRRFVRRYGNDLSTPVVLKVPSGAKWEVELVKHDGEIWLQNGWQEFLKYYSLDHGFFLVFKYNQRNYNFNVIIFDKSAIEIDYPRTDFALRKRGISCQRRSLDEFGFRIKPLTDEEKAKTLDRAMTYFKFENPFFIIAMKPTYVHPAHKLAIPASFAKKYFVKQCDIAILSTVNGKTWSVEYNHDLTNRKATTRLGHGWKQFACGNHLKVCDVCVFQLINHPKTTLNVVIFRCKKDSKINPSLRNNKQLKQNKSSHNSKFMQRHSCSKVSEAVEVANRFTSLNLFFEVNMRHYHLFLTELTKKREENVILQFGRRQWPVKLIIYRSHRGWFSEGWASFAKGNSLQAEDVCVFELVNRKILLLKVSIFRNVK